jgi:GT2 family glycosyltransferase
MKKFDLIIVSYKNQNFTYTAIDSAKNNSCQPNKIIVVDNHSNDGSVEFLRGQFPDVVFIENPENYGYAKAINIGIKASDSEFVIVSNNDVVFSTDNFEKLINHVSSKPDMGVVGVNQKFPNGKIQHSFGYFPSFWNALSRLFFIDIFRVRLTRLLYGKLKIRSLKKVDWVDGAVLAINRKAFEDIGGFNEEFFFYSEEADFCKRLKKKGWEVAIAFDTCLIHYRGQGEKNQIGVSEKNILIFVESLTKLCEKHLSTFQTKLYLKSSLFFYKVVSLINYFKFLITRNTQYKENSKINNIVAKEISKYLANVSKN